LRSERVQKRNQIGFLLGCKTNIETHVVKDDDICECRGRTIVKVRRAARKSTENWTFHFSYIRPLSSDKSATSPMIRHFFQRLGISNRSVVQRVKPARCIGERSHLPLSRLIRRRI
jgi:hypothetical protein